jgi:carboxymethylenebutenolidase
MIIWRWAPSAETTQPAYERSNRAIAAKINNVKCQFILDEVAMKFRIVLFLMIVMALLPMSAFAQDDGMMAVESADVDVMSGGQAYASYVAAPAGDGPYPAVVLIHSFRGLEQGYRDMTDQFAAHGFVVLSVGWQTFEQSPSDDVMAQLLADSVEFLRARDDVDPERLGLTGFCAGGRYTMLFLPQMKDFAAGVAWYGFPYNGDNAPADHIDELSVPMLIIHGTEDSPSPIETIFQYVGELRAAGKTFEVKVYSGEPHGFMLADGQLREDDVAVDAFTQMVSYFTRHLG